jgi:hypothetical protein
MFLPFTDGLIRTNHFDQECRMLADRHYSRRTIGASQFCYSGRKLVLRDVLGTCLFVWMFPDPEMRMDRQDGYNCAIFRNESTRRSSEIILEAETLAIEKWGPHRFYTYIDPLKVRSPNPGYCFKVAGWTFVRVSQGGKHLLAKELDADMTAKLRAQPGQGGR